MCIVFFEYQPNGSKPYVLILASNRDEFYSRSTTELHYWPDQPSTLAGRDTEKGPHGGTWLGINKQGRFGVLTNYRKHVEASVVDNARSRGYLVTDYLHGPRPSPYDYCTSVMAEGDRYEGFSLITGTLGSSASSDESLPQVVYCSNVSNEVTILSNGGTHSLSNEQLDSPWLKQVEGRKKFETIISDASSITKECLTDRLIDLLCDTTCYGVDPCVRDTGHSEEAMRGFNSVFVTIPSMQYGTRTNSVILIDHNGEVTFTERTMAHPITDPTQPTWTRKTVSFNMSH